MTDNYTLLFPQSIEWKQFTQYRPDVPFSDAVIEYLNALSGTLLKERECRIYPDAVTFAFFCRKANLLKLKEQYVSEGELRLGRGTLFHIAPSNVPINFGYSLVAGLVSGNANVVRVSSKYFPQVDLIIRVMKAIAAGYPNVSSRIALVRYDHMSDANAYFSSIANVRVIWGGDVTIQTIRQNAIPPRSFDVCFADRYSIAALKSVAVMAASDAEIKKLAEAFYNDTYLFDQNACSAPHTIFWLASSELEAAKKRFWTAVYEHVSSNYQLQEVMSVAKLATFYRQAAYMDVRVEEMPDNLVVRVELKELPKNIEDFRCTCGYFSEKSVESLDEISPIVNIKYQSLGYFGFEKEELNKFVIRNRFQGLDRIVPIGETTVFSFTWDGYNLINTFTRVPSIL